MFVLYSLYTGAVISCCCPRQTVPLFAMLLFARDTSSTPRDLMTNHLNHVGDSGGLEQVRPHSASAAVIPQCSQTALVSPSLSLNHWLHYAGFSSRFSAFSACCLFLRLSGCCVPSSLSGFCASSARCLFIRYHDNSKSGWRALFDVTFGLKSYF